MDSTLQQAHAKISELRDNKEFFTNMEVSFNWTTGDSDKTIYKSFPPQHAIKAATMDIRIFLQPGTPFIMGSLVRHLRGRSGIDQEKLEGFYEAWLCQTGEKPGKSAPMGIVLNMDDNDLTLKEQIDLWTNGNLFHIDATKAAKLERMHFSTFRNQSWMIFVGTLQNLASLLFYFDKQFLQVK